VRFVPISFKMGWVSAPLMISGEWRGSRRVILALHGRSFPTDEEWAAYLDCGRRAFQQAAEAWDQVVGFAVSDGGAPTARQRVELRRVLAGRTPRSALLTPSRLARGIGAAVTIFNPATRIHVPSSFFAATRHVGLHDEEASLLGHEIERLAAPLHLASVAEIMRVIRLRERAL